MKYTNIKKLLIKFMGGGLINFPTRFLRWIKIDGDAEGDDGGGDGEDDGGDNTIKFGEALNQVCFLDNQIYGKPDAFLLLIALSNLQTINLENPISVGGETFNYALDCNSENCIFKAFDELVQDDFSNTFRNAYFCYKLEKIGNSIEVPAITLYSSPYGYEPGEYYYNIFGEPYIPELVYYNEEYYLCFNFGD